MPTRPARLEAGLTHLILQLLILCGDGFPDGYKTSHSHAHCLAHPVYGCKGALGLLWLVFMIYQSGDLQEHVKGKKGERPMLFMHRKHITLYTVKKKILVNNYKYVWNMAAMTFFTLYCYFFPFIIIYCQYIAVTHYSVIYYCNTFTFPSNKLCKGLQFQNQLLYHVAQCCCIARAQFGFFSTAGCLMMV